MSTPAALAAVPSDDPARTAAEAPATADVVVVGAPRSGTSLVAQLAASGGAAFGDHLLPASPANPRGFLEDVRVTELNDALLAPHVVGAGALPVPDRRLAWAGAPADGVVVTADDGQRSRMAELLRRPADADADADADGVEGAGDAEATAAGDGAEGGGTAAGDGTVGAGPVDVAGGSAGRRPVGVKDPRFVWTLDAWLPVLRPGTALVAVVRHPAEVAASLATMAEQEPGYWAGLDMTVERGLALWEAVNRRLLAHLDRGRWLVVEHGALLDGRAPAALAGFTGRPVDAGAVDPGLRRSPRRAPVPASADELFARLCERADRDLERWSDGAR